jgi:hypothetical protein
VRPHDSRENEIGLILKPGQKGAKALVERYGDDFVCVRYRYDEASRTRIKTVELIVARKVLPPSPRKIHDDDVVPGRVAYGEMDLGKMGVPGTLY